MNKKNLLVLSSLALAGPALAQSAMDGYNLAQPDMKGTARFMSMGGAFGALGGDLSTLSQNPAGIGVYRNGDVGFTLNLDCQSATSESQGIKFKDTQTKFLLNNIGAVLTMRLQNEMFPNVNFGFSYNKGASFNRKYSGQIPRLNNSMSNYVAGIANSYGLQAPDVTGDDAYSTDVPWLPILAYQSYLIEPSGEGDKTQWFGQWGDGTTGTGSFNMEEKGSLDEYNIAIGGNIANVLYWGMNFDITNINYTLNSRWGETLDNAYLSDDHGSYRGDAMWDLTNYYHVNGTGFNYQLGLILKPIQELRIGFAFHTPTWYSLTESYGGSVYYQYDDETPGIRDTNKNNLAYNDVNFRTPWKLIGSIAGVIGGRFIISADYEWQAYNKMKYSAPGSYGGGGWGWDYDDDYWPYYSAPKQPATRSFADANDAFADVNSDIEYYYQSTNTLRLGAEYRVTPAFSLRAGYSFVSSPVKESVRDDRAVIYSAGTRPSYRFDDKTNYITCGFGYRYQQFYLDMAYVYKNMKSTYHAYSPDVNDNTGEIYSRSPQSSLSFNNSQIILTAGFRF